MREFFYKCLSRVSDFLGSGFFLFIARGIAAGYFILFPGRVRTSADFYRALFPGRSRLFHLKCAWRQFQNFTTVFLDRHLLKNKSAIQFTFEGRQHLIDALERNEGGILLMSHLGNWEVGARLLRQNIPDLNLMLYVGQRAKDQIEQRQKEDLAADGIRIVAVDQEGGSAFDLVEAITFLRSGGFVSMAGDLIWRESQRSVPAVFLGHRVHLPEAPHMMALVTGMPLFIFFASSTGAQKYHFRVCPPVHIHADKRSERREAIGRAAQVYMGEMESQLRQCPYEWYHFRPFIEENPE